VNLFNEDKDAVNIQSIHAIDIFAFVEADEIPPSCFDTPYYLTPEAGDERVYVLLRDVLKRTGKIGMAHVTIRARHRLAVLIPCGQALFLNTLRLMDTVGSLVEAKARAIRLQAAQPTEKELEVAAGVVEGLTRKWDLMRCPDGIAANEHPRASDNEHMDILSPRVRSPKGRTMKSWLPANGVEKISITTQEATKQEAVPGNHTILQAQRAIRPRSRVRRTYH
jgi:hypothetical protein